MNQLDLALRARPLQCSVAQAAPPATEGTESDLLAPDEACDRCQHPMGRYIAFRKGSRHSRHIVCPVDEEVEAATRKLADLKKVPAMLDRYAGDMETDLMPAAEFNAREKAMRGTGLAVIFKGHVGVVVVSDAHDVISQTPSQPIAREALLAILRDLDGAPATTRGRSGLKAVIDDLSSPEFDDSKQRFFALGIDTLGRVAHAVVLR
jgi:hypothetical protein